MTDSEFTFSIFLGIFMLLTVFQQYRIIRLRRKIERIAEGAAARPIEVARPPVQNSAELDELRKRVQVLERIATDGNPTLDHQFEELRRAG